jgi:hypothetical protein
MNAERVPFEALKERIGYASEGSACLREAPPPEALRRAGASVKAGPLKHVEEPQALVRGAPLLVAQAF